MHCYLWDSGWFPVTLPPTGQHAVDVMCKQVDVNENRRVQLRLSLSVSAEETGVDLGQKKDSYFYSCCHSN